MMTLTLELSAEQYAQLQAEAKQAGEPVQQFAHRLLTERRTFRRILNKAGSEPPRAGDELPEELEEPIASTA